MFARYCLKNGFNTEFKVKLTPQYQQPAFSQSLLTPTTLMDDLLFDFALTEERGIITTVPFSKYSSPIFVEHKPNGKLRILFNLRLINHIIKHYYGEYLKT